MGSYGLKESCIRLGPDPPCRGAIIRGKGVPGHAKQHFVRSCAKMAEPIDLPFGLPIRVARRKHKFNRIHLMEGHIGASLQIRLNRLSAVVMWPYVKLL